MPQLQGRLVLVVVQRINSRVAPWNSIRVHRGDRCFVLRVSYEHTVGGVDIVAF